MHNRKVNAKCIHSFLIKTLVTVYTSRGTLLNYYSASTASSLQSAVSHGNKDTDKHRPYQVHSLHKIPAKLGSSYPHFV